MIYREIYGLENAETVFRGTFRYPGWCDTLFNIAQLGFLDDTERSELNGKTLAEVTAQLIGEDSADEIRKKTAAKLNLSPDSEILNRFEWLGLFGDDKVNVDPPTYLDVLAARMLQLMPYKEKERDMLVMQHDFIAEYPGKKEHIISLMIDYGIPGGDSSMSRTVSLPAAIATKLILDG
jgi:saccharopine dehydrogenase-like NADP-dependent oxidoreductase